MKLEDNCIRKLTHYYETSFVILMKLAENEKLSRDEIVLWVENLKAFWQLMMEMGVKKETLMDLRGGEWLFNPDLPDMLIGGMMRLGFVNRGVSEALK